MKYTYKFCCKECKDNINKINKDNCIKIKKRETVYSHVLMKFIECPYCGKPFIMWEEIEKLKKYKYEVIERKKNEPYYEFITTVLKFDDDDDTYEKYRAITTVSESEFDKYKMNYIAIACFLNEEKGERITYKHTENNRHVKHIYDEEGLCIEEYINIPNMKYDKFESIKCYYCDKNNKLHNVSFECNYID